ncbi:MAG: hypothetical protein Q7R98_01715 [Candidatus Jorgensenbacteria bacterium]|nr:hypothetical protein [Candidatus Jorgensenbacteria bacterium]
MALETLHNRIREIQRANDDVKRRWLIILSSAAMIIVIGLWFLYLNVSIPALIQGKPDVSASGATSTMDSAHSASSGQVNPSETSMSAEQTNSPENASASEENDSFFSVISRGAINIWSSFIGKVGLAKGEAGDRIGRLMEFLGQSREFSITATSTQFKPEQ